MNTKKHFLITLILTGAPVQTCLPVFNPLATLLARLRSSETSPAAPSPLTSEKNNSNEEPLSQQNSTDTSSNKSKLTPPPSTRERIESKFYAEVTDKNYEYRFDELIEAKARFRRLLMHEKTLQEDIDLMVALTNRSEKRYWWATRKHVPSCLLNAAATYGIWNLWKSGVRVISFTNPITSQATEIAHKADGTVLQLGQHWLVRWASNRFPDFIPDQITYPIIALAGLFFAYHAGSDFLNWWDDSKDANLMEKGSDRMRSLAADAEANRKSTTIGLEKEINEELTQLSKNTPLKENMRLREFKIDFEKLVKEAKKIPKNPHTATSKN